MNAYLRRAWPPAALALLAYGFWNSAHITTVAAGVALFLFGMLALEQGLRAFAGGALDGVLRRSTDRLWKSVLFGFVSTSLAQSSSLISVLTISFLSAGLIGLAGGIGILFGANLGTTTGAWLIAGFGLKVSISVYAMPLLAFGAVLIFQPSKRWHGPGYVLAGLGILLLGIDMMKQGFDAFKATVDLAGYAMPGLRGLLVFTAVGVAATVIMQSSHATLVLILTALAAGQISYENALALAVGSNVGTTVTALIASVSANVDGRRLAAAHMLFNLVTGAVAVVFMQKFIDAVDALSASAGIGAADYTLKLALFHSLFNLVGIALMLPLVRPLQSLLLRAIKPRATLITRPKYLSEATVDFPDAAIEAARRETERLYAIAVAIIAHGLSLRRKDLFSDDDVGRVVARSQRLIQEDINEKYALHVKNLYGAIVDFVSRARTAAGADQAEALHAIRGAGACLVEAIKAVKHLQKNLNVHMRSPNPLVRAEYDKLRALIGQVMKEIEALRDGGEDGVSLLSLDEAKLLVAENSLASGAAIDRLIRERRIDATVATSLINDSGYARDACDSLIEAAQILFVTRDPALLAAEQSVKLGAAEITRIAQGSIDR